MKKYLIFALFAVSGMQLKAQESQTVFNFLRLPVSSHAAALGGENISLIEDDASLVMHNPALLQSVSDHTVSLGYMNYMSGCNVFSAGFDHILAEKATAAVNIQYADYGKQKHALEDGTLAGDEFKSSDLALSATLSYTLLPKLVGGVTARFIYSNLCGYHSTAVGVDLGLNYYDDVHDFSASVVAKNLGGQLSAYNDDYEKMPADLQVGLTKRLIETPIRLSLTASDLTHWDYSFLRHLTVGADLIFSDQIYVGVGYSLRRAHEMTVVNSSDDDSESSHGAGFSIGAGINLESFKVNVSYGKYHVSSSALMVNLSFPLNI